MGVLLRLPVSNTDTRALDGGVSSMDMCACVKCDDTARHYIAAVLISQNAMRNYKKLYCLIGGTVTTASCSDAPVFNRSIVSLSRPESCAT